MLFSNEFKPENNSQLNYRQIEFSWPQIPHSNSYEITINDVNSDFSTTFNADYNIIIYDGYDLDWGASYSWVVCGLVADTMISECHEEKYFSISQLPMNNGISFSLC